MRKEKLKHTEDDVWDKPLDVVRMKASGHRDRGRQAGVCLFLSDTQAKAEGMAGGAGRWCEDGTLSACTYGLRSVSF